jgi:hypothetical protein
MWGYKYNTMKDQRLIRNWAQVANSDTVFAIGTLGKEGDIWKGDEKSKEPRKLLKFAVQGGTGYAVEMAIQAGKPVYVFDQVRNQWYKNINGEWSKSEVPTLTKNFAGIGTREINEAGKQAIRDVYANTFKDTALPTQPTVEPVGEEDFNLELKDKITILEAELADLEQTKQEMLDRSVPVLIATNLPKIKPDSARRETGVAVGTSKDINPGLLSNNGVSVERAAEMLSESLFYEGSGFPEIDVQEIRDYIIDILQTGVKNYVDEFTEQNKIDNLKSEIAQLKEEQRLSKDGNTGIQLDLFSDENAPEGYPSIPRTPKKCE